MLELINIKKQYAMQDEVVHALKGVNIKFRETEFVSILGQSGCGKTTLLNIIGGLDKYTDGDLKINGISTKKYTDKDWDTYRNHKIGFIFQSYNLIPHLTVLENVELALTLSGISKNERKTKAKAVLEKVGLSDKLKNKPNQLSGGQMQRVAIARALVNDPDIILADEPTGALDSKTSVQIMDILKSISNEKLIIMVTHNPELAEKYSSRIIKLLDGNILSDSKPFSGKEEKEETKPKSKAKTKTKEIKAEEIIVAEEADASQNKENAKPKKVKKEKTKMTFFTALSLSFKNLLTKKARTFLVSFAGSIGIIGIALILSLSTGFQAYVDTVQKDTLSSYPIQINKSSYDIASLMQIFLDDSSSSGSKHGSDKVYTKNELTDMLEKFNASSTSNDLKSLKAYLDTEAKDDIAKYVSAIQYVYDVNVNSYYNSAENGIVSSNLTTVFADTITKYGIEKSASFTPDQKRRFGYLAIMFGETSGYFSNAFWSEMLDNQDLLKSQYELVGEGSKWAEDSNEVMIVLDKDNEISDYTLFGLGLLDQSRLYNLLDDYVNDRDSAKIEQTYEYSSLLGLEYRYILDADFYESDGAGGYTDIRDLKKTDPTAYTTKLNALYASSKAIPLKVAGIIKPKPDVSVQSIGTTIAYSSKLTKQIIEQASNHSLVQAQIANPTFDVLKNKEFEGGSSYLGNLKALGYADLTDPSAIYLYPINFDAKKGIEEIISNYNNKQLSEGHEDKVITYTDLVGSMISSISVIISAVSYVLIAFVSISLIVSSIMIGIITYISVLERIKEIGVLRSLGASKKDIKRVFVSESVIIGFIAGVLGIVVTLILNVPINLIINSLAGLNNIASLPIVGGLVLIVVSVLLTFIAGLIPAKIASKKDPVIALRTE